MTVVKARALSKRVSMALLVSSAIGPVAVPADVTVDFDRAVDFSRFRTFDWREGTAARDPMVEKRIRVAVERELIAKRFKKVREDADLWLVTHAAVDGERQVEIDDFPYWRDHRGWKRPIVASDGILEPGCVIVDIVERQTGALVWRGAGTDNVAKKLEKRDDKLIAALSKMFKRFPPR